jgi:hypothetical protein
MSIGLVSVADAETYKCEDPNGEISYLSSRCEAGSKERTLSSIYNEATDIPLP